MSKPIQIRSTSPYPARLIDDCVIEPGQDKPVIFRLRCSAKQSEMNHKQYTRDSIWMNCVSEFTSMKLVVQDSPKANWKITWSRVQIDGMYVAWFWSYLRIKILSQRSPSVTKHTSDIKVVLSIRNSENNVKSHRMSVASPFQAIEVLVLDI